jgi:fermentation-respiration switch protein FrsA (DUF1100 family)
MSHRSTRWSVALLSIALAACARPASLPSVTAPEGLSANQHTLSEHDLLDEVFTQADLNHDGALTPAETGFTPDQFAAFDRDGDGRLTRGEWFAPTSKADADKLRPRFGALKEWMDAQHQTVAEPKGDIKPLADWILGPYLAVAGRLECQLAIHPPRIPYEKKTPADWGLAYSNVSFKTQDGLTIRGWWIPALAPTNRCVVLLHGWSVDKSTFARSGVVSWFAPYANQLVIDMRNNGDSDGTVTTFNYSEHLDALAAIAFAKSRGMASIGLYGNSMGAATAIRTAAESSEVKAIWDDCGFGTIQSAWEGFARGISHCPVPELVSPAALSVSRQRLGIDMRTYEPVRLIARISPRPLQIVHGGQDELVPPVNSEWNFAAAGDPKNLWIVPGAGHGGSAGQAPEEYKRRLAVFFQKAL